MRRFLLSLLIAWTIYCCLFSCSNKTDCQRTMDTAEALLETAPDSSLMYINDINVSLLTSDDDKARYALIKSMALYKNYIDVADDSLISLAYNYYSKQGNERKRQRMLSAFNMLTTHNFAGDYENALSYGMEAIDLSTSLKDTLWMARSHDIVGGIYERAHAMDLSAEHFEKAKDFYQACGKDKNVIYVLKELLLVKDYLGQSQEFVNLADSIIRIARAAFPDDKQLLSILMSDSFYLKKRLNDNTGAKETLIEREQLTDIYPLSDIDLINACKLYCNLGDYGIAENYIDRLKDCQLNDEFRCEKYICNALIASGRKDYQKAAAYYDSLIRLQNQVVRKELNQPVIKARGDYIYEQAQIRQRLSKAERQRDTLLIIILLLLVIAVTAISVYMIRKRDRRIRQTMDDLAILTELLNNVTAAGTNSKSTLSDLENKTSMPADDTPKPNKPEVTKAEKELLDSLFSNHIQTINSLCAQFFEEDQTRTSKIIVYNQAKAEIQKLRESQAEILKIVDHSNNGILTEIRNKLPELENEDMNFLGMLLAGFNTRIIAVITGLKPNSVYSKRRRLLEKLHNSGITTNHFYCK